MNKLKETINYLCGTIGVSIFSFILSILYSRFFSPSDYGDFSLMYSIFNLGYQFFTGWITHSILRYYSLSEKYNKKKELFNTVLFTLLILGILYCIIVVSSIMLLDLNTNSKDILFVFSGVFFLDGFLLIFNTFLRSMGKSKEYSKNISINSFMKSGILIIIYYIFQYKNIVIISLSLLLSDILQCTYLIIKNKLWNDISYKEYNLKLFIKLIKYGLPLIGTSLIFWIIQSSDKFVISYFYTNKEVGLYSYGYQMGFTLFYTFSNAIMLGAYPKITNAWNNGNKNNAENVISRYIHMYLYLMIPALFGIIALGNCIIIQLCDARYYNCSNVFIVTCIAFAVFGFLQYTNKAWELFEKTKVILILNIISALENIILNVIFIPIFGYEFAAFSTLISFLTHIMISLLLSKKMIKFSISKLSLRNIMISSLIMFIFELYFTFKCSLNLIMIIIVIILGVIIYFVSLYVLHDEVMLVILKEIKIKLKFR